MNHHDKEAIAKKVADELELVLNSIDGFMHYQELERITKIKALPGKMLKWFRTTNYFIYEKKGDLMKYSKNPNHDFGTIKKVNLNRKVVNADNYKALINQTIRENRRSTGRYNVSGTTLSAAV